MDREFKISIFSSKLPVSFNLENKQLLQRNSAPRIDLLKDLR